MTQEKETEKNGQPRFINASNLLDQLALIGLLVLLAGIVSVDTYYHEFSVMYQSLGLSTQHIMYRGITALRDFRFSPSSGLPLLLLYFFTAFWLTRDASTRHRRWLLIKGNPAPYLTGILTCILIVVLGFWVAYSAKKVGLKNARRDMTDNPRNILPKVLSIRKMVNVEDDNKGKTNFFAELSTNPNALTAENYRDYRLLIQTDSYVVLFQPLTNTLADETNRPIITRLSKDHAQVIECRVTAGY